MGSSGTSPRPNPNTNPVAPAAIRGRSDSRDAIYPHRSVRYLPVSHGKLALGVAFAALLSIFVAMNSVPIMAVHWSLVDSLCQLTGLPVATWNFLPIYSGLGHGAAPVMEIPTFGELGWMPRVGLVLVAMGLFALRRVALLRNMANFFLVLLLLSALANVVFHTYRLASIDFGQLWLRVELLVWLLLPWVTLLLFYIPQRNVVAGMAWMLFLLGYGFFFSVLRMTFCLGVLHYTGLLFAPLLWLGFGTLSDLLFLLFFYSIATNQASSTYWGQRSA